MQAVFLDKDGTLIENIPYNIAPEKCRLLPGVKEGLRALNKAGYELVVVSNQSGVARGYFSEQDLIPGWNWLREVFWLSGARLLDIIYCPHLPDSYLPDYAKDCFCRKPNPGMLLEASNMHGIDLAKSWMLGDILDDVEAGHRAGCRSILLDTGNETEWLRTEEREPDYSAKSFMEAVGFILAHTNAMDIPQKSGLIGGT